MEQEREDVRHQIEKLGQIIDQLQTSLVAAQSKKFKFLFKLLNFFKNFFIFF